MSLLEDMWNDGWMGRLFLFGTPLLVVLFIAATIADANAWAKFSQEHACKKVGEMSGSTFNTFTPTSNGLAVGIGSTPGKTGYACNDGVTYWR